MLDDKISMMGIDPKNANHQWIKMELRNLLDEAPSDASIRFKYIQEAEGPICIMKIYSQCRKFSATSGSKLEPKEVCAELCADIRRQLTEWKKTRFQPTAEDIERHAS